MRKSFRAAVVVAGVAVSVLATAPIVQAAMPGSSTCISASGERDWGRGEITMCPLDDGRTQLTGWVEDLKPGNGWVAPDAYCVGWWIKMDPHNGRQEVEHCPHFRPGSDVRRDFDYTVTTPWPVTGAVLSLTSW